MMNVHILVLYTHHVIKADQTACLSTFIFATAQTPHPNASLFFVDVDFPSSVTVPRARPAFPPPRHDELPRFLRRCGHGHACRLEDDRFHVNQPPESRGDREAGAGG